VSAAEEPPESPRDPTAGRTSRVRRLLDSFLLGEELGPLAGPLWALATVATSTLLCYALRPWFTVAEHAMVYLLGVLAAAARLRRGHAALAAASSLAALDFFFVPPHLGFVPTDTHDVLTLVAYLATSLVVSGYAGRVRRAAQEARERERRTAAFYAFSSALAGEGHVADVAAIAANQVEGLLGAEAAVFRGDGHGGLEVLSGAETALARSEAERAAALEAYRTGRPTGRSTGTCPEAAGLHLPLVGPGGTHGVLAVALGTGAQPIPRFQQQVLDTFAALTAVALERALLAEDAERNRASVETERLRSTLLSGVSHDLRTPLATMTGAAGALLTPGSGLSEEAHRQLLTSIRDEGERMGRLVANLLDLTRIEAGGFRPRKEWYPVEELVTSALDRLRARLDGRPVGLDLPREVLLVRVDGVLLEQVLVNLIDNATKHTPAGSPIDVMVRAEPGRVLLEVRDRGAGIPRAEGESLFAGFHRRPTARSAEGTGLGLSLCRAIVRVHGGTIEAEDRDGGGAVFRVAIPREEEPVLGAEGGAEGSGGSP
jgi:two-component system sensor histidine kinase KdpD